MRKVYTLLLAFFMLTYCHAQKTDLVLKLKKGKEYKQLTNSKATIIQDINGQKVNMVMTIEGGMSYLVKAVRDEGFEMEVKYDSLSLSLQLPQGTMHFSSEKKDEQDIFSMILSEMKNKPFHVLMTRSGKIAEVKNIESLFESAFKRFPQIPEAQLAQMKAQLDKAYGAEAFKGNIEMVTAIFPEQPVAKGEDWTIHTKLESGMAADMETTYTFIEKNRDFAVIHGKSEIKTADKDAYVETNGMPMKYDLAGTMASEIKVDINSGWIIEAKIKQEIQGDAFVIENPKMPNGMKIPMSMKNEMRISNS